MCLHLLHLLHLLHRMLYSWLCLLKRQVQTVQVACTASAPPLPLSKHRILHFLSTPHTSAWSFRLQLRASFNISEVLESRVQQIGLHSNRRGRQKKTRKLIKHLCQIRFTFVHYLNSFTQYSFDSHIETSNCTWAITLRKYDFRAGPLGGRCESRSQ